MKKILIVLFFIFVSLFTSQAYAASSITYPIEELGGCKSQVECKVFCDKLENRAGACFEYAKKNNLITQEEIQTAEKFTQAASANGGPSFCKRSSGCKIATYCDDPAHLNDCLGFAQQNNLIPEKEIEQTKKVVAAVQRGNNMPGGCNSKEACSNYCTDLSHSNECLKVAQELGIVTANEVEDTKKFIALAQSGQTPGGAKSKQECLKYCQGNLEECLSFAGKAGFLNKQEIEIVKKTGGNGPGGCHSKGECETYCNDSSHKDECLKFAKENNINVSFNGPGGCSDVDSCTKYCMEHKDDATCKQYTGAYDGSSSPGGCSDEASCKEYCMKNQSDAECKKMMEQYGGFSGPGGCSDMESCKSYCMEHKDNSACQQYAGQYSGGMPKGPGGCTDVSSCSTYCKSNPKDSECAQYAGQYGQQNQQQP